MTPPNHMVVEVFGIKVRPNPSVHTAHIDTFSTLNVTHPLN